MTTFKTEIDKHVKKLARDLKKSRHDLAPQDLYAVAYRGFWELMMHKTVLMKAEYLTRTFTPAECEAVINAAITVKRWEEAFNQ